VFGQAEDINSHYVYGKEGRTLSPVAHTLVQLLLSVLGSGGGGCLALLLYPKPGQRLFGPHIGLPPFFGAVAGFFVVFLLWDRFVPVRCPRCNGSMREDYGQGRHLVFRCDSCDRRP
jgi:hypothetical protein